MFFLYSINVKTSETTVGGGGGTFTTLLKQSTSNGKFLSIKFKLVKLRKQDISY